MRQPSMLTALGLSCVLHNDCVGGTQSASLEQRPRGIPRGSAYW